MNASSVSRLPRFDGLEGLSPLTVFDDKARAVEPVEVAIEPHPVEVSVVDRSVTAPAVDEDALFREEANTVLKMLRCAIHDFEVSAATNIAFAIKTMVGEVFPHLSSVFLSEEFALNIPELIKFVPPKATIQAPARVAEHLILLSRDMENWPEDWDIEVVDGLEDTRVDVVWDKGGLTYDYNKVLEACLARLGVFAGDTEEK